MRKIIFLDIDGVIATPESIIDGEWGLVDSKQLLLKRILDETGAEIVLSSSWRLHTVEETKKYMSKKGFFFSDKIVGVTIRAYQYIDRSNKIHLSIPRGVEIQQWIDTHIHSDNGKNFKRKIVGMDYSYVILDDDVDMLFTQRYNFINTNSLEGLSELNVSKAIEILNFHMKLKAELLEFLEANNNFGLEDPEGIVDSYLEVYKKKSVKKSGKIFTCSFFTPDGIDTSFTKCICGAPKHVHPGWSKKNK